jgi:hypothetical protein
MGWDASKVPRVGDKYNHFKNPVALTWPYQL